MAQEEIKNGNGSPRQPWGTREKILLTFGIVLISAEFVNAEVLARTFHYEFLLAGLLACGIAGAIRLDKM